MRTTMRAPTAGATWPSLSRSSMEAFRAMLVARLVSPVTRIATEVEFCDIHTGADEFDLCLGSPVTVASASTLARVATQVSSGSPCRACTCTAPRRMPNAEASAMARTVARRLIAHEIAAPSSAATITGTVMPDQAEHASNANAAPAHAAPAGARSRASISR